MAFDRRGQSFQERQDRLDLRLAQFWGQSKIIDAVSLHAYVSEITATDAGNVSGAPSGNLTLTAFFDEIRRDLNLSHRSTRIDGSAGRFQWRSPDELRL